MSLNGTSTASNDIITLFDLPSKHKGDGTLSSFSLHPWKKGRLVLNFKSLPYETEWSEYPELGPKLKALGIEPNSTGLLEHSSPTIRLPDGTFVMDSLKIANTLEELHPDPSLHLEADLHGPVTESVEAVALALLGEVLLPAVRNCLTEKSSSWFQERFEKKWGTSVADLHAQKGGEEAWRAAEAPDGPLEKLRNVLNQHKVDSGPFLLGSHVSYGDFVAVAFFESLHRVDVKTYVRLMSFDGSFPVLHQACRPWLQRDI